MLETTLRPAVRARRAALRLARQAARARLETLAARGRGARAVHDRDPDRDRRDRAPSASTRCARSRLAERYGHVQEVIVQNFRAKPGTRMAAAPEPPLEELLWTIAAARILLAPEVASAGAAEPDLGEFAAPARRRHRRLGRRLAGHDRPRQPRGAVARARSAPRGDGEPRPRARAAAHRLSASRISGEWLDPRRAAGGAARVGLARARARGRWSPGETGRCRSSPARPAAVDTTRRARGGRDRAALPRARQRAPSGLRRRRQPPPRGQRRRGQLRRDAEHPVHERLLLPLRLLRVLEGQARGEPARRAVPRAARGDRAARRGGVGARGNGDLPPGRDPPCVRRRLLPLGRSRDQGSCSRPARARVHRARDLAGSGDARRAARGLPHASCATRASVRFRARRRRFSTTRCGGDLPGQGHDGAVARGARRRASGWSPLERDDHVRPRRGPAQLGAASRSCARAAALEWRLHRVRAAPVRAHGSADLAARAGALGPDVRGDAARARSRAARARIRGSRTSRSRG